MNIIIERFLKIQKKIKDIQKENVNIVAVSKTFPIQHIQPLIDYGHKDFGENKVQEAILKWGEIKKTKKDLSIHLIGSLQSNKAKKAVKIFDYIHSLDNEKLANKLAAAEEDLKKNLKYFIQLNIGNEKQKSGIKENLLKDFVHFCKYEKKLNIVGLMIIPPMDENTENYFKKMKDLKNILKLKYLSMGMTSDYLLAMKYGSTHLRVGTAIFGERS